MGAERLRTMPGTPRYSPAAKAAMAAAPRLVLASSPYVCTGCAGTVAAGAPAVYTPATATAYHAHCAAGVA